MSKSNSPYSFELFVWAMQFSQMMTGEQRRFLIVFGEDDAVREIQFGIVEPSQSTGSTPHENALFSKVSSLRDSNDRFFFFDPYNLPEDALLHWQNAPQSVLERLLGAGQPGLADLEGFHPTGGAKY